MFDYAGLMDGGDGTISTGTVRAWLADLARLTPVDDAARVEALRALEELKGAAARRRLGSRWPSPPPSARPRSLPGSRPVRSAPGSGRRWPWPAGTAPPEDRGTWGWPGR